MKSLALFALVLAACGSDSNPTNMDSGNGSGSGSGSGSNKVQPVSCTGATKAATVTTDDTMMKYLYSSGTAPAISAGAIVEFKTSVIHNVIPGLAPTDPGLKVDYSSDVCLKFTAAGTYNFICQTHGFKGTIVVN